MEKYRYSKLSIFIILIPTPNFPYFYYMLGGNLGSLLYGDVSMMRDSMMAVQNIDKGMERMFMQSDNLWKTYVSSIHFEMK